MGAFDGAFDALWRGLCNRWVERTTKHHPSYCVGVLDCRCAGVSRRPTCRAWPGGYHGKHAKKQHHLLSYVEQLRRRLPSAPSVSSPVSLHRWHALSPTMPKCWPLAAKQNMMCDVCWLGCMASGAPFRRLSRAHPSLRTQLVSVRRCRAALRRAARCRATLGQFWSLAGRSCVARQVNKTSDGAQTRTHSAAEWR